MALLNFKPARQQVEAETVVDLDAITSEPKAFRWKGKSHIIKPIDTLTFLKVTEKMSRIQALLSSKEKVSQKEVIDAYSGIFGAVCDSISKNDVLEMTQAQVGALFQLICEIITGKAQKKTQVTNPTTT